MVDQDKNKYGNPGHTHPGASSLGRAFLKREMGEERGEGQSRSSSSEARGKKMLERSERKGRKASLTYFLESEEDLSSNDPDQGAALNVRSIEKERKGQEPRKTKKFQDPFERRI
ncbi:hypothetical protein M9H77_18719 [Catharanthus roseus]|uniref:Uncharacterized protein n=1 Tax=Catharanthus roseus TaxID=4058 RepID=A0ACC0B879_CATRO|nr:hypothetical protein M9H77_18719 [Catharanthus roseus]